MGKRLDGVEPAEDLEGTQAVFLDAMIDHGLGLSNACDQLRERFNVGEVLPLSLFLVERDDRVPLPKHCVPLSEKSCVCRIRTATRLPVT